MSSPVITDVTNELQFFRVYHFAEL